MFVPICEANKCNDFTDSIQNAYKKLSTIFFVKE